MVEWLLVLGQLLNQGMALYHYLEQMLTGDTTISAGKLTVSGTLSDSTDVINSGIYDVDATDTIQSLDGSGNVEIASSVDLTVGDSNDKTISGVRSGARSYKKSKEVELLSYLGLILILEKLEFLQEQ